MALIFVSVNIVQYPTERRNARPYGPADTFSPLVDPVQYQRVGACETDNERNQPSKKEKQSDEFHSGFL
ncbi:hypothetical protein C8E01_101430 [Pontibacter virosus]|uniref:Uncharacterized protein n=1 Tax=Pontibacter virosus TaxID=1765052 RepID=A0A2U1B5V1_9BACT|nr:hypothetical protein C8E01_101430 [Pontibacter virosus]